MYALLINDHHQFVFTRFFFFFSSQQCLILDFVIVGQASGDLYRSYWNCRSKKLKKKLKMTERESE
jgi:hypothetical protein